jgi:hypothetical protein
MKVTIYAGPSSENQSENIDDQLCVCKKYIEENQTHFLAGLIRCRTCDGAIVQTSSKGGEYYECSNAKRKACNNKLLVPRKRIETIIINDLKEKFLTAENGKIIESRSYYVPHTNIQILALLDEERKGSSGLQYQKS